MTDETSPASRPLRTIIDVAKRFNVSPRTVRRWIDAGELEVYYLGRNIRISDDSADDFLETKRRIKNDAHK